MSPGWNEVQKVAATQEATDGRVSSHEVGVRSWRSGADDGIRTRDPHLGKVMLYQLSHVRSSRHSTATAGDASGPVLAVSACGLHQFDEAVA